MGRATWIERVQVISSTLCLAYLTPSMAQSPGGVVPTRTPIVVPSSSDLAPPQVIPLGTVDLPGVPKKLARELGKPEDDLRIDIVRYSLDDSAPPALRARLDDLTRNFVGKDRSFEDLNNAKAEVTRFLQSELGYYLGYAYVPEQLFKDGVVQLAVLEGRLDKVVLKWPAGKALPVRQEVVQGFLDHLKEGSILLVRDLERVVFLVNDLSGIKTKFDIQPGSKPGTADIVVTPEAESIWLGKAEADVNGSRYIGALRLGGLVQMNSPFGRGDVLTANVLTSMTQGLSFGLLGYSLPVGSDGIKVGSSLSAVKYQLDKALFPLDLNGTAVTFTGYGLYPVIRARNLNLFSVLSVEHKAYEDRQGAADSSSRKNVDTLGLGGTGDFRDSVLGGGVSTFDVNLISGRVNYPAGRPGGLEDAPSFTKLSFGFSRLQDLLFAFPNLQDARSGKVLAYASMRGQIAFANLDTTEQFRIGGSEGVRAFAPGEGTGDEGVVLSLEARLLPPESWFGRISSELVMSAFVDAGFVRYRHKTSAATVGASANTELFSGAGLALSWVRPGGYAVRASLASPISGVPRSDPLVRSPRLYLLATKFFN
jgi:hemolysin activation/secretion protein